MLLRALLHRCWGRAGGYSAAESRFKHLGDVCAVLIIGEKVAVVWAEDADLVLKRIAVEDSLRALVKGVLVLAGKREIDAVFSFNFALAGFDRPEDNRAACCSQREDVAFLDCNF